MKWEGTIFSLWGGGGGGGGATFGVNTYYWTYKIDVPPHSRGVCPVYANIIKANWEWPGQAIFFVWCVPTRLMHILC